MSGKTVTVSTAAQLTIAVKAAKGGDTILLAAGNYGDVAVSNFHPTSLVTIKSADPDNDAVMRSLWITRVSNVVFEDFDVNRTLAAGVSTNTTAVQVNGGVNLTFSGVDIHGSLNGSALDDGHGMIISGGNHISIIDSTFQQLRTAVIVRGEDFLFAGNTVTEVQEGISISSMTRGVFQQNYMANWQANYAAGAHPDMFQVHSGGKATASSDLIFRDNVMLPGVNPVGGILIGMSGAGRTDKHEHILIENNYYEGAYRHAISVNNANDIIVRDNTVLMGNNAGLVPAINLTDIRGGLIEDNVSTLLLESRTMLNSGMTFSNNVDVWDPQFKKGMLVSDLFSGHNGDIDFSALNVIAGTATANSGAGFEAVANIGSLPGSVAAQMAAWLPTYSDNFTVFA